MYRMEKQIFILTEYKFISNLSQHHQQKFENKHIYSAILTDSATVCML